MKNIFSRMSLKTKFISSILAICFLLTSTLMYFILSNTYKQIKKETFTSLENKNKELAIWTQNVLDKGVITARSYSATLLSMKHNNNTDRNLSTEICKELTSINNDFYSVWGAFVPNGYDGKDSLYKESGGCNSEKGRFSPGYYRDGNSILLSETLSDAEIDTSEYYTLPKEKKEEIILEPLKYSYTGNIEDEVLETSILVPIMEKEAFIGVVGIDISLETLDEYISKVKLFETGFCKLISNEGLIVSHYDKKQILKPSADLKGENGDAIKDAIKNGKTLTVEDYSFQSNKYAFKSFAPIKVGSTTTPWSIAVVVPVNEVLAEVNAKFIQIAFLAFIGLIILALALYRLISSMVDPITKITLVLDNVAKGEVAENDKLNFKSQDEVGKIGSAVNQLIDGLTATSTFAQEIGSGNLNAEFQPLSKNDVLGNSLLDMRKNLDNARIEEEKRKLEDNQRNWSTSGQAKFAEILRQDNNNIEKLSFNLIKNLVNYCEANQGGVFILNDSDKENIHLELTACYAYNRQKYIEKNILIGEGLVGTCFLEGKTIFLTEVPQQYMNITSGLGNANPKCILIVPLKLNDIIYGIVEIASFKVLEHHEIEFVEKLGESIASTISSVKVNIRTAQLLETSQQQAEEMRAQEEEMRQNMEEMHATQEELQRKDAQTSEMVERMKVQEAELKVTLNEMSEKEKYTHDLMETMKQQEEEMRQNMEEMLATQEEMARKEDEVLKQNELIRDQATKMEQNMKALEMAKAEMEQKQIEVQENEQKILKILDSSPDAIISVKLDATINGSNVPMFNLTGYDANELQGFPLGNILKFLKFDRIKVGMKKREKAILKDGSSLMVEIIFGQYTNKGELEWLFFMKNVTEEIRKEQDLTMSMEKTFALNFEMKEKEKELEKQVEEQMLNLAKLNAAQRTIEDNNKVAAMKEKRLKTEIETLKQKIQELENQ